MTVAYLNNGMKVIKPSTKIYRIMELKYFIDLFVNRKNTLVRPSTWSDKSECNLLKVGFDNKDVSYSDLDDMVYAQCWSLKYNSSLMWDSYTQGKPNKYVRIQTTVEKLFQSLIAFDECHMETPIAAYISRVDYIDRRKVIDYQNGLRSHSPNLFDMCARAASVKSTFFSDEAEVRLICFVMCADYNEMPNNKIFSYWCDPHKLVDLVRLPPHLNEKQIKRLTNKIRRNTDYSGPIERSSLLDPWEVNSLVICTPEELVARDKKNAEFAHLFEEV